MASSPLVDLLADEHRILRRLDREELRDFLTDVDRMGWALARLSLCRFHSHLAQEDRPYGAG